MKRYAHAIITGGSSGIGLALAEQLYREGSPVTLVARDRQKLDAAQRMLQALDVVHRPSVHVLSADVRDAPALAAGIQAAAALHGAPDLLITSAGIAEPGYFEELPFEEFEQAMSINYMGTVAAVKAVLPLMRKQQAGHVVMISSAAGLLGIFGYTSYSPTKFALRGFAEALDQELEGTGIRVSIAFPSDTDTPQLHRENARKPKETFAIARQAKAWTAQDMATAILQGVRRQAFSICPGFEIKLLGHGASLLLPLIRRYFKHLIRKARR